jgi:hypothetical protein
MLFEKVKEAMIRLWLYDELGTSTQLGIESRSEILRSISKLAISALEEPEQKEDANVKDALIRLCDLPQRDMAEAEQRLHQVLSNLSPDYSGLTDQDRMDALEYLAHLLIREISAKPTLEQAKRELSALNHIATVSARLAFAGDAELSESMDKIVRDFEHANEDVVLRSIYQDIRSGVIR